MDNVKKKIGYNVKKYRLSRGLKQSELAELVGVEDKTISRIEVGGNYPSMDLLVRISEALHYDLTDFVNFKDNIDYAFSKLTKSEIKTIKKFVTLINEKIN